MALEQIFSCPKTLARLQKGPLGELLEGFCLWLMDCGFGRWTIRSHSSFGTPRPPSKAPPLEEGEDWPVNSQILLIYCPLPDIDT